MSQEFKGVEQFCNGQIGLHLVLGVAQIPYFDQFEKEYVFYL